MRLTNEQIDAVLGKMRIDPKYKATLRKQAIVDNNASARASLYHWALRFGII